MGIVTMIRTCAVLKEQENSLRIKLNNMDYGEQFKKLESKLNNVCLCKYAMQEDIRAWRKDENREARKLKRAQINAICRILKIDNGIVY